MILRFVNIMSCFSSGTASDSICPKGWRLPGSSGDGSYNDLVQIYANRSGGNNSSDIDTIVQISPFGFLRSGRYLYDSGSLSGRTSYGDYWSGRFYSITYSYSLIFHPTGLGPQYGDYRGLGFSLRCLARYIYNICTASLPALLLILYVPKVGDYREVVEVGHIQF